MSIELIQIHNPEWDKVVQEGLIEAFNDHVPQAREFKPMSHSIYGIEKGELVGGVLVDLYGDTLWIDALWVSPHHRFKKLGSQLMAEALRFARLNRCKEIQLNTYFHDVRDFYIKCGFEMTAHIPNWKYSLDCYLMRRIL